MWRVTDEQTEASTSALRDPESRRRWRLGQFHTTAHPNYLLSQCSSTVSKAADKAGPGITVPPQVVALKDPRFVNPDYAVIHAPLSLTPVPYPRARFELAQQVQSWHGLPRTGVANGGGQAGFRAAAGPVAYRLSRPWRSTHDFVAPMCPHPAP